MPSPFAFLHVATVGSCSPAELPCTTHYAIQNCRISGVASGQGRGRLWCTPAVQLAGQKVHPFTHFHAGMRILYWGACSSSLTCAGSEAVQRFHNRSVP